MLEYLSANRLGRLSTEVRSIRQEDLVHTSNARTRLRNPLRVFSDD
jgi:hypothetical protein